GLAAGRGEYSAGGYVATMKVANSATVQPSGTFGISQADRDEYEDKVIDANGASTLLHPSMKGEHAERIADRLRKRAEKAKAAYDAAPNDPRTKRAYMKSLADIADV